MIEGLQRKPKTPLGTSEKGSPLKNITAPTENFATKKGFLSSIFTKKKGPNEPEIEMPSKPNEGESRFKNRQKIVNRKNIADGLILLNVKPNDRVAEDFLMDYKDNPFEILDHNPSRTTSYIENLRSRDFSEINNNEVKQFLESQDKKEIAPSYGVQNIELELLEVSRSYEGFLGKFYRFFQGLLPGFSVIFLFLIFAGSDDQLILNSFVLSAIRVYQIFYIVALVAAVGAFNRYLQTRAHYQEVMRSKPSEKAHLSKQAVKYVVATLCFVIVYGMIVYNHEFVSKLSDRGSSPREADFRTNFKVFRTLAAMIAAFSLFGWLALVLAFEEVGSNHTETYEVSIMVAVVLNCLLMNRVG